MKSKSPEDKRRVRWSMHEQFEEDLKAVRRVVLMAHLRASAVPLRCQLPHCTPTQADCSFPHRTSPTLRSATYPSTGSDSTQRYSIRRSRRASVRA